MPVLDGAPLAIRDRLSEQAVALARIDLKHLTLVANDGARAHARDAHGQGEAIEVLAVLTAVQRARLRRARPEALAHPAGHRLGHGLGAEVVIVATVPAGGLEQVALCAGEPTGARDRLLDDARDGACLVVGDLAVAFVAHLDDGLVVAPVPARACGARDGVHLDLHGRLALDIDVAVGALDVDGDGVAVGIELAHSDPDGGVLELARDLDGADGGLLDHLEQAGGLAPGVPDGHGSTVGTTTHPHRCIRALDHLELLADASLALPTRDGLRPAARDAERRCLGALGYHVLTASVPTARGARPRSPGSCWPSRGRAGRPGRRTAPP